MIIPSDRVFIVYGHGGQIFEERETANAPYNINTDRFPMPEGVYNITHPVVGISFPAIDPFYMKDIPITVPEQPITANAPSYQTYLSGLREYGTTLFNEYVEIFNADYPITFQDVIGWEESLGAENNRFSLHAPPPPSFPPDDSFLFNSPVIDVSLHIRLGVIYYNDSIKIYSSIVRSGVIPQTTLVKNDPIDLVFPFGLEMVPLNQYQTFTLSEEQLQTFKTQLQEIATTGRVTAIAIMKGLQKQKHEVNNPTKKRVELGSTTGEINRILQIEDLTAFFTAYKTFIYTKLNEYFNHQTLLTNEELLALPFDGDGLKIHNYSISSSDLMTILKNRMAATRENPIFLMFWNCRSFDDAGSFVNLTGPSSTAKANRNTASMLYNFGQPELAHNYYKNSLNPGVMLNNDSVKKNAQRNAYLEKFKKLPQGAPALIRQASYRAHGRGGTRRKNLKRKRTRKSVRKQKK